MMKLKIFIVLCAVLVEAFASAINVTNYPMTNHAALQHLILLSDIGARTNYNITFQDMLQEIIDAIPAGSGDVTQAGQNNFSGSNYFGGAVSFGGSVNINNANATSTLSNLNVTGWATVSGSQTNTAAQTNTVSIGAPDLYGTLHGDVVGNAATATSATTAAAIATTNTPVAGGTNWLVTDGAGHWWTLAAIPLGALPGVVVTNGSSTMLTNKGGLSVGSVGQTTIASDGGVAISNNVAGAFGLNIINTSTSSSGWADAVLTVQNSTGMGQFFKACINYTGYKSIQKSDLGFFNSNVGGGNGNISILNDNSTANINLSVSSTTPQFTLTASDLRLSVPLTATNGLVLPGSNAPIKWIAVTSSNPPTSGAGTAFIFAATNSAGTAEIFTMDGAGTVKQISEHAMDAPDALIDDDDEAPNISKEILMYSGKVRWINRSRAARLQELSSKAQLNSLASYQFLTGKSSTQWTNANAFATYTNALLKLDGLGNAGRQIVIVETFNEYNTRLGLTNGNGLVKVKWADVQAKIQSDYAASYTNALNATLGTTNPPPVWNPPAVEPVPSWLQKRNVQ